MAWTRELGLPLRCLCPAGHVEEETGWGGPQVLSRQSCLESGARQGVAEPSEGARVLWRTPQELSNLDPG